MIGGPPSGSGTELNPVLVAFFWGTMWIGLWVAGLGDQRASAVGAMKQTWGDGLRNLVWYRNRLAVNWTRGYHKQQPSWTSRLCSGWWLVRMGYLHFSMRITP